MQEHTTRSYEGQLGCIKQAAWVAAAHSGTIEAPVTPPVDGRWAGGARKAHVIRAESPTSSLLFPFNSPSSFFTTTHFTRSQISIESTTPHQTKPNLYDYTSECNHLSRQDVFQSPQLVRLPPSFCTRMSRKITAATLFPSTLGIRVAYTRIPD